MVKQLLGGMKIESQGRHPEGLYHSDRLLDVKKTAYRY